MKIKSPYVLILLASFACIHQAAAQGTAFSYQGRLNSGGIPANGLYDFRFKLESDALGNFPVTGYVFTNAIPVSNGLFMTTIDFGSGFFNGSNYWLDVEVRTNNPANTLGYAALTPLQALTPVPYAIFASTASNLAVVLPSAQLSGTYGGALTLNNAANTFSGSYTGNGGNLTNVNAVSFGGLNTTNYWQLGGNSVAAGQFLGSTNSNPVEIWVGGSRALRLEPAPGFPANIIGGYSNNFVSPGAYAATIAGGGLPSRTNMVTAFAGTVGGGYNNSATNADAVVAGGANNLAGGNASTVGGGSEDGALGDHSSIVGGQGNQILVYADHSSVAGGGYNMIVGSYFNPVYGIIAGGYNNQMLTNASYSFIGGGYQNTNADSYATLSGGALNLIGPGGIYATVGGGYKNNASAYAATVAGGQQNVAGENSTVGGGVLNLATGAGAVIAGGGYDGSINQGSIASGAASFVGGGLGNTNTSEYATIGGGINNSIQNDANDAVIAGGANNFIFVNDASIGGGGNNIIQTNSDHAAIGGGWYNGIGLNNYESVIAGGYINGISNFSGYSAILGGAYNYILSNSTYSAIGGGGGNNILPNSIYSAIGGGGGNIILSNAEAATIGGGFQNTNGGQGATLGGGNLNLASAFCATIAGGQGNLASGNFSTASGFYNWATNSGSVVAGGGNNFAGGFNASIVGGSDNNAAGQGGAVGGGYSNNVTGNYGTIPGGTNNTATNNAFAAGTMAQATNNGAFVWSDDEGTPFGSTTTNQFAVRANGGIVFVTSGAGMTLDGQNVLTSSSSLNASQLNNGPVPLAQLSGITSSQLSATTWQLATNLNGGNAALASNVAIGITISSPVITNALVTNSAYGGNGGGLTNVNALAVNGLNSTNFWQIGGNNVASGQFIGSTNNQAVEFRANNIRALRLEPGGASSLLGNGIPTGAPNVIGGSPYNYVASGVVGGTVAGGGATNYDGSGGKYTNSVSADFGTVSGGAVNSASGQYAVIGGGLANTNSGYNATVAGGAYNSASSGEAVVCGGNNNFASGSGSFIGGGGNDGTYFSGGNKAAGGASVISGGYANQTSSGATYATVPGGANNVAGGKYSFAAGQQAQAENQGAFVWADSQDAAFASTANDQFLIRAQGGVGINTSSTVEGDLCVNTNTYLFSHILYLRGGTGSDHNHGLAYCGPNATNFAATVLPDGPVLWGYGGGALGVVSNGSKAVLVWSSSGVTVNGISVSSDRNVKSSFATLNPQDILAKVASLPVTSWVYTNDITTRHIGPMAQDFHAAFASVGGDDKHINLGDEGGVALAAIQGLNQKVESENSALRAENAELKQRLDALEKIVIAQTPK